MASSSTTKRSGPPSPILTSPPHSPQSASSSSPSSNTPPKKRTSIFSRSPGKKSLRSQLLSLSHDLSVEESKITSLKLLEAKNEGDLEKKQKLASYLIALNDEVKRAKISLSSIEVGKAANIVENQNVVRDVSQADSELKLLREQWQQKVNEMNALREELVDLACKRNEDPDKGDSIVEEGEVIKKSKDAYVQFLCRLVPVRVQNFLRDSGCMRVAHDAMALLMGGVFFSLRPLALYKFFELGNKERCVRYGKSREHGLFIHETRNAERNGPVLIFVHGGAWGGGAPFFYRLVASNLGEVVRASYVVKVGYPVYPSGTILDQQSAVREALLFLRNDAEFAELPFVLAGHSR